MFGEAMKYNFMVLDRDGRGMGRLLVKKMQRDKQVEIILEDNLVE